MRAMASRAFIHPLVVLFISKKGAQIFRWSRIGGGSEGKVPFPGTEEGVIAVESGGKGFIDFDCPGAWEKIAVAVEDFGDGGEWGIVLPESRGLG